MRKPSFLILFFFTFLLSCQSKPGFDAEVVLEWDDKGSRNDDVKVIKKRLEKIGIKKYTIQILDDKTIRIEAKKVKDTLQFIRLMEANVELAFWETYENPELFNSLNDLNSRLAINRDTILLKDSSYVGFERINDSIRAGDQKLRNPLWSLLQIPLSKDEQNQQYLLPGPVVGWCRDIDTAYVDSLLRIGTKVNFPKDLVLFWTLKPMETNTDELNTLNNTYSLVALKKFPGTDGAFMTQIFVKDSRIEEGYNGKKVLIIKFDKEGTTLWEKMTRKNIGKSIAITLDNKVLSYPQVESTITGGVASVSGNIDQLETIQMGIQMIPYKTQPRVINHHFEKRAN